MNVLQDTIKKGFNDDDGLCIKQVQSCLIESATLLWWHICGQSCAQTSQSNAQNTVMCGYHF